MTISSRRAAAPTLRNVIDEYRAEQKDKHVLLVGRDDKTFELLNRLAADSSDADDADKAFRRLSRHHRDVPGISAVHGANVLHWCIMARLSLDKHHGLRAETEKAKHRLAQMVRVDNALAELRKFVAEQNFWPPFGQLSCQHAAMKHGLDLIADRIGECRCYAKETPARVGATRKMHTKEAAENAAIWVLAENVKFTTGKPHHREVAHLARVILETDVDPERVRHAVRKRKPAFLARILRRPR
jgi:hypothetical protein